MRVREFLKELTLPDGLFVAGACSLVYGVGTIYHPAAYIAAGLIASVLGWHGIARRAQ